MAWLYVILAIIVIALVIVIANLKIVPQSKAYVIERLGAYLTTWQTGFHVKIPFFERIAKVVSLKEQVVDFAPQPVITKDNVTMQIDTCVLQITDPSLYITVLNIRFRLLKISRQPHFVTSSARWSLTQRLHRVIP